MEGLGITLVAVAMLAGLLGVILPFFPGLPIVWTAALAYGIFAGFGTVGWIAFGAITVLFVSGMAAAIVLPKRHVSAAGAPRSTIVAGLALGIIGFFVIPVIGLPLGAAVGVLLAERSRLGSWGPAWTSTKALIVGFGVGALVQFGAGVAMVGCWVAWVILG